MIKCTSTLIRMQQSLLYSQYKSPEDKKEKKLLTKLTSQRTSKRCHENSKKLKKKITI